MSEFWTAGGTPTAHRRGFPVGFRTERRPPAWIRAPQLSCGGRVRRCRVEDEEDDDEGGAEALDDEEELGGWGVGVAVGDVGVAVGAEDVDGVLEWDELGGSDGVREDGLEVRVVDADIEPVSEPVDGCVVAAAVVVAAGVEAGARGIGVAVAFGVFGVRARVGSPSGAFASRRVARAARTAAAVVAGEDSMRLRVA